MDKSQCLFFSFWNYILFCALLQMLTPTHVYIFLPSFSQYESEFDYDKDIKPVYKKKKIVAASRIYASISISFICCNSHVLLLRNVRQLPWKRKSQFFSNWKTCEEALSKSIPPFPHLFHDIRETKQKEWKD